MTTEPAQAPPEPGRGSANDLFGRGMLYVVVWSAQMVVATVVSPILAHTLDPAGFGHLSAAIALFQLLGVMAVFGLDQALEMQRVEDADDDLRARGLLACGVAYAFAVAGVLWATHRWWAPVLGFTDMTLVAITLLWTAPGAAAMMCLSLLQAEDRLREFCVVSLFSSIGGQVVGIALLFAVARSADVYAAGGVVGQFAALGLGLWWARPRLAGLLDLRTLGRGLRLGIPLVLANLAQFVLNAADRFVIQRWLGPEEVARFQVAFTVGNVMALLLGFTNRAWLPRLKSITSAAERWVVINRAKEGIHWLLGWALLGITVSAPPLLRVFAPASYRPEPLPIVVFLVALSALPIAETAASSQLLITQRRSGPLAWGAAAAVVVKVVLTLALLRPLGLPGAAGATLAAVAAQALWVRRAAVRGLARQPMGAVTRGFVLLSVAAALASTWLPQTFGWNVARFVFSCACVPLFFHALRLLQRGAIPFERRR